MIYVTCNNSAFRADACTDKASLAMFEIQKNRERNEIDLFCCLLQVRSRNANKNKFLCVRFSFDDFKGGRGFTNWFYGNVCFSNVEQLKQNHTFFVFNSPEFVCNILRVLEYLHKRGLKWK